MINCTFNGKYIVISGASGGLGKYLVDYYINKEAIVIGIDINKADIDALPNYHHIEADVSVADNVSKVKSTIQSITNSIDILINCAGKFMVDPEVEYIEDASDMLWKGNALTSILLSHYLIDLLAIGHNPIIINIASTDGVVASSGQDCEIGVSHDLLYATTKGAVVALTRSMAMKLAPKGIRVNAICPTIFHSPMTSELLAEDNKVEHLIKYIPLGRLCLSDDIAAATACLYYLSMTTGHLLPVDGGYLCM